MLVYEWASGELIGVPRSRREDPGSAFVRFKQLPLPELVDALTEIRLIGECKAHEAPIALPDWLKFLGKVHSEEVRRPQSSPWGSSSSLRSKR